MHSSLLSNSGVTVARSPEPELPRPPPDRHRRARSSADPPSPGTCLASSLGHMEAPSATHYWASPLSSLPSELPRSRRLCAAAAARRRPPRSNHRHRSIAGEPNFTSLSLDCLLVPHLAGEHAAAVGSKGRGTKGLIAKDLKLLGSYAQKYSFPFAMYWLKLVKSI
jgi:hypothetical protein